MFAETPGVFSLKNAAKIRNANRANIAATPVVVYVLRWETHARRKFVKHVGIRRVDQERHAVRAAEFVLQEVDLALNCALDQAKTAPVEILIANRVFLVATRTAESAIFLLWKYARMCATTTGSFLGEGEKALLM